MPTCRCSLVHGIVVWICPRITQLTIAANVVQSGRDLSSYIERALGPSSLGIIAISDVPGYEESRQRLLQLALRQANDFGFCEGLHIRSVGCNLMRVICVWTVNT